MSAREKGLLGLLALVGLLVGGMFLIKFVYLPRYEALKVRQSSAEQLVESAQSILDTRSLYLDEMDWLAQQEPAPISAQDSQTALQAFAENSAKGNRLEIRTQSLLPSIETAGKFYHRARLEMLVSGREIDFYRWLIGLNNPNDFRRVTFLRMNPKRGDDTQIEARIVVEQWFVPLDQNL